MNRALRYLLYLTFSWLWYYPVQAQTALNPNDPVITYNAASPPPAPAYNNITKWVRTVRMYYNTDSYKCYIYKNMAFRLKFPKTYVPGVNDGKKYPIYLFFHGVGEKGTIYDNEYQLLWGGQTFMNSVDNGTFDGFLLYPQSQGGYWGPNDYDNLKEVIDSIVTSAKGDPDRLSLNGLSGGAYASWEFMMRYPQLIADALPMSGVSITYPSFINTYKYTPLWIFQGGLDGSPAPYTTNTVVNAIKAAGGNVRLTTYPNDAHNTWIDAWNEPDFIPFMLRANRLNPYPLFGSATFCAGDTIIAGIAPGFLQYEWQKDGVTFYTGTADSIIITYPGAYRVRAQLPNGWTGWSPSPLVVTYRLPNPAPTITTVPTLASNVLPAPDGSTSVTLQVPPGMNQYEWLLAGNTTVLSTTNTLTTSIAGGYIVRIKAPNYCLGAYADTFKVIKSAGINGPDPISGLVVSSVTKTQISLSWVENATPAYNEKYFEIYRALQPGGPYTLAGKNNTNVVTFTDNNLIPATNYFYKVRPVNDNAAGPVSAVVVGTTAQDSAAPSAPPALTVSNYTNNQVTLTWLAATDDAGIANYDVYANNVYKTTVGNVLTATVTGLADGTLYNFYVKARDVSGKYSTPSNQVTIRTLKANLTYKFYTGYWSSLPNFNILTPVQTGNAYIPDLSQVPAGTGANYAYMWTGYIKIPVSGTYTFETNSDDGSKLYFNTTYSNTANAIVNNDGTHAIQFAAGTVFANAGVYPVTVTYFQGGGAAGLQVYWTSPAAGINTRQLIPSTAFIDTAIVYGSAPVAPSALTVNVNNYNKLNLAWTDNSNNETGFEIYRSNAAAGTYIIVATTAAKVVNYTDTALQANTTYYYKTRAIGLYGESAYTTVANGTTANPPLSPAAPSNLVTQALSTQVIKLTWTDNANNETSNEVYRSLADSTHFSFLKSLGPVTSGQGSYSDSGLAANTVAYYKVRSANAGGYSAFTKATYGKSGDNPPVIAAINNQTIRYGTTQTIPVTATDPDNDSITLSLYNAPAFMNLQQSAGNTSLYLAPTAAQQGIYNNIGVIAADNNGGIDTTFFNVIVNSNLPASGYKLFLNFKLNNTAPAPWNNIFGTTNNNLKNDSGQITNVGITFDESWWAAGIEGATTNNNNGIYPDVVMSEYLYFGAIPGYFAGATTMHGHITGLETNRTYTIKFFSSSKWWVPQPDNGSTQFTINSTTKTLYVQNNTTNRAIFDNIKADANGEIKFTLSIPTDGQIGYLNALELDASSIGDTTSLVNQPPIITPISNQTLAAGDTLRVPVSGTDPENDTITYTGLNLPPFATIVQSPGNVYLLLTPANSNAGQYNNISIVGTDTYDNKDTVSFNLIVNNPLNSSSYKLLLNLQYNNAAPAPWNNITGSVTTNLKNDLGQTTTAGLKFDQSWWATNGEGAITSNNSGVYPDVVMSGFLYFGALPGYFTGAPSMTGHLTGLETGKTYTIKFFSSSKWWVPQPDNGSTRFTINGISQTLHVQNNTTNVVSFTNLTPDTGGEIVFTLSIPTGGQVGYLNAIEVDAGGTQLPVINHAPVISNISDQSVQAGSSLLIPINASDPDNNQLFYSTVNMPSFVTLVQSAGNVYLSIAPSISNAGTYNNVSVIVQDPYNAADTTTFNLTVTPAAQSGGNYKLLLNFKLNSNAPAPWNNISSNTTSGLINELGQITNIGLKFDESWWAAGIEGATTGNNTGIYPDVVLREYLYFGALPGFFTGAPVMHGHLTGLAANTSYTVKFFAGSKWWAPQPDNGSTQFTINGVTKTLYVQNNTANTADFVNLTADGNGEIVFTLSIPPGGSIGYLNAMEVDVTSNTGGVPTNTLMRVNNQNLESHIGTALTPDDPAITANNLQVKVFPNPYVDNFYADITLQKTASLQIEISDMSGEVRYSELRKDMPPGKHLININTQNKINVIGIYFLKITSANGETKSIKLVKHN